MRGSIGPKPSVGLGAALIMLAVACVAVMSALDKAANDVSTGVLVFWQNFLERIREFSRPGLRIARLVGRDLKTLYTTTADETMVPDQLAAPLSGSLVIIDCGTRGVPARRSPGDPQKCRLAD